ncbi:hypothetical protein [Helicobacter anatolicus]|uniref:hypothetical protein n=1 Tax=Helicobacter anatolicus TaxID=2905874 RepID=UPI001E42BE0E|nr:hypothetical protein [Helicobacter anatolicus]MCE3040271.1 hypothetical protein [Helicobacter anatolicus]
MLNELLIFIIPVSISFLILIFCVFILFSSFVDYVFRKLFLKDLERRLLEILKKHGISAVEMDFHSCFKSYPPSVKESVKILEIIYGIKENDIFAGSDFSEFQKVLKNIKYTQNASDNTKAPANHYNDFMI